MMGSEKTFFCYVGEGDSIKHYPLKFSSSANNIYATMSCRSYTLISTDPHTRIFFKYVNHNNNEKNNCWPFSFMNMVGFKFMEGSE